MLNNTNLTKKLLLALFVAAEMTALEWLIPVHGGIIDHMEEIR
ncbi:hypothetical protein [Paenibacillus mendelii]|uniref:Uncharacterized protein n=1 Tax=Paenibacillus mendelii TaxID=206163 RepID=A0ABV6J250_9BACL|nr:hypothetical protein [Paenibacillus mendelii]MCQ6562804.1 hypothetical protein [Paenibacillus mendelii]